MYLSRLLFGLLLWSLTGVLLGLFVGAGKILLGVIVFLLMLIAALIVVLEAQLALQHRPRQRRHLIRSRGGVSIRC